MDCSPPGFSVSGILQARILDQVAISFCRESSWPRNWTVSPALQVHSLPLSQISCSVMFDSLWPHESARQASLSITNSQSLLTLMSIELVMPSSHLILSHPLLLLPPITPSIRVFSNESTLCMRWPKYWSFSFSISPCNEHPGLNSFRMDWLDLLAEGTLKSLLQQPQFKSINSSAVSFLHSPTLTSIHDHWKNRSLG